MLDMGQKWSITLESYQFSIIRILILHWFICTNMLPILMDINPILYLYKIYIEPGP